MALSEDVVAAVASVDPVVAASALRGAIGWTIGADV